ncbi:MAG: epoxyqueuosine reductase QueH [Butyrivibrio sp.]|nr:epoxyqueuosine reductase QueH [Butyrivibrio sp.]
MNSRNYSKELEKKIEEFQRQAAHPKLLLHACCAPCSSYCLEYLREYFDITVFFYNPNITEESEYRKRVIEEKRLIEEYNRQVREKNFEGMNSDENARIIEIIEGEYKPSDFFDAARGYEDCKEGGERCRKCFELRLRKTAQVAEENGFDYFTTTLTISPLKNADVLNEVGEAASAEVKGTEFLPSDFKKKNGYKRSIELSHKFDLYRQDFCGCSFSKAQREREKDCH